MHEPTNSGEPMVRAESLCKEFQTSGGGNVVAVHNASLSIYPGEIFGLLGPNGAGKTTLLRMLATIISPTSGRCTVAGEIAGAAPGEARRKVGFLSGTTRLYGRLSGRELLQYFGRLYGMSDKAIAARTEELVVGFDMAAFINRRCETLSTGQTQKVSIARVLLHDPPILILDEPTLGLDIMTSRTILDFIVAAKYRNHSIIFSTHYMTEAEMLCDRVGLMYAGELMAIGTKQELYDRTGTNNLMDAFLALVVRYSAGLA
jgi:sodium transport system ATP-binding protein